MLRASKSAFLDHLEWHWDLNAPVLNTWHLNVNDLWHLALDHSLPMDNPWALSVCGLVPWTYLGHLLVAWHLDVHWDFNGYLDWDVHVLVFWDKHFLFLDHVEWDDFFLVDWVSDWLVIVTRLLHDDWDFLVDTAVDSAA